MNGPMFEAGLKNLNWPCVLKCSANKSQYESMAKNIYKSFCVNVA